MAAEPGSSVASDRASFGYNWAGMYLGANLGAAFPLHPGEHLQALSGFGSPIYDLYPASATRPGATVGISAGFNWQKGHWVWGLETELDLLDGRHGPNGVFPASPVYTGLPIFTLSTNASSNYFASFRGRVGLAYDRALVYLTGGVASGGARGPAFLSFGGGADFSASWSQSSRMKFVAGIGFEYAFAANWSARAEYLFLSQSMNTQIFDNGAGFDYASRLRNETHIFRMGLNFHFGDANRIPGSIEYGRQSDRDSEDKAGQEEQYSVHGQSTTVAQAYPKFRAFYDGPLSLPSKGLGDVLTTNSLFLGVRLWEGGAAYVNPEADLGYGLANSVGVASYVDGVAQKLGRAAPYMRFERYFLRQIIGLDSGGDLYHDPDEGSRSEVLESVQNQVSGKVDRDRIIVTLGKFAVGDVFDDNVYAHDPTTGFLNFAFNNMGAFDYAADSWGYTYGLAAEWKQSWWTARAGAFQLSTVPNGPIIEPELFRQYMAVTEFEARYELFGHPGAVKFLLYGDNGRFARLQDVVDLAYATGDFPPDAAALRRRHFKTGGGINIKQEIADGVGFFARASAADGRYETIEYTDVDRQISAGFVLDGKLWGREDDEIGVAGAISGLSGSHVQYFALGGTGIYVGDGALAYSGEKILENYYKLSFGKNLDATLDYQLVINPAFNSSRGPVNVFGLRLRAAF